MAHHWDANNIGVVPVNPTTNCFGGQNGEILCSSMLPAAGVSTLPVRVLVYQAMTQHHNVGLFVQVRKRSGCILIKEAPTLVIIPPLRIQDCCHEDDICSIIVMLPQRGCIKSPDPPKVHNCTTCTSFSVNEHTPDFCHRVSRQPIGFGVQCLDSLTNATLCCTRLLSTNA